MIAKINRRVKQLEKHLDIKIVYQGEEVEAVFERFFSFSFECADITLYSSERLKRYKLHYDFNNGLLRDWQDGFEVDVTDLFSCRHLRSILFAAYETRFLNSVENLPAFTIKIHKDFPTPVFCTQTGNEKKWFLINSIDIVNNSKINMEGLVSIDNTYPHQPTTAKCVFDIKKELFIWEYSFNGNKMKEAENENYYSYYKIKMADILYSYTEYRIDNPNLIEHQPLLQNMVSDMLKVLKKQKIHFFTKKRTECLTSKANFICGLFWNIKSVNNDEIIFVVCDGDTLSKEVTFNRIDRKIYASMPGSGRTKKQEMMFGHNADEEKDKFFKVIKLIEKKTRTL